MVEERSEPNLTPRHRGAHHELSTTIKCQKCSHTSPEGGASEKKVSHPRIKRDFYF